MRLKTTFIASVVASLSLSSVQAAINILVDTSAKTFDISGSLVATPLQLTPLDVLIFSNADAGTSDGAGYIDITSYISTADTLPDLSRLSVLETGGQSYVRVDFVYDEDASSEQTIIASGTGIDYTSLDNALQVTLETLASADTILTVDSGTSTDSILLTTVPEPSAYAALAGLIALGFVASRRTRD